VRGRPDAGRFSGLGGAFDVALHQGQLAERHAVNVAVYNFASIKPLDVEAVQEAARTGLIITAEDHQVDTGLGARVAAVLAEKGPACGFVRLGVKKYGLSGKPEDLYRLEGINWEGMVRAVLQNRQAGSLKK